jgi:hypothetical protein
MWYVQMSDAEVRPVGEGEEMRYVVMAHADMTARFYRIGERLIDTADADEANRVFHDAPRAREESVVLYRFGSDCPDGRELASRW